MEETILLNFEIDQTQAQKQLVQTEKNILSLKKQQSELNKEYKEGTIEQDEYVKSNLALQKSIKRETDQKQLLNKLLAVEANSRGAMKARIVELNKEWDSLNTKTATGRKRSQEITSELKKLNSELNKASKEAGQFKDNIGNYPERLAEATSGLKVAGTSVDDLKGKLGGLNAATATVGALAAVVGTLASAYASSTTGARDLAFAQNFLGAATRSLSEDFAQLISASEKDGEGFFTRLAQGIVFYLSPQLAIAANEVALLEQRLKDLETARAFAAGFGKEDERRAENLRRIRDDEEKSERERLQAAIGIEAALTGSAERTIAVIKAQIEAVKGSASNYSRNTEAQLKVAQLTTEISDKEEEINGKLTENFTARKAIEAQMEALFQAELRLQTRQVRGQSGDPLQGAFPEQLDNEAKLVEDFEQRITDTQREYSNERIRQKRRETEARIALEQHVRDSTLDITAGFFATAASLFDQQSEAFKTFATFETLISTYSTAQKAYEAAFVPPTAASPGLGTAYAALAVAQGLARVAQIHGVQFAEGGYTGPGGKYQPAGIVHAGEVVWNQRDVAMAGGPAAANALRPTAKLPGYADGGFVTNQNIAATQQAMITANAIKNMPPSYVSWAEGEKVGRRVKARENLAKI